MGVEEERVDACLVVRQLDGRGPRRAAAKAALADHHAALFAAVQEDLDAVDAGALLGGAVGGSALDDVATHVNGVTRRRIADFEADRRRARAGRGGARGRRSGRGGARGRRRRRGRRHRAGASQAHLRHSRRRRSLKRLVDVLAEGDGDRDDAFRTVEGGMRVGDQVVTTDHVGQLDGGLEAVRTERAGGPGWNRAADLHATRFAAVQEEFDMINACTLGGGTLVHGDAPQHVRTRFEHRTRVGVRQLEADARTCAGSGRGGSLRQSR